MGNHDALVSHARAVAGKLGLAIWLHPDAGALVDEAGGLERQPPRHRRLHLAEHDHPTPGHAPHLNGNSVAHFLRDGGKVEGLDLDFAPISLHPALQSMSLHLVWRVGNNVINALVGQGGHAQRRIQAIALVDLPLHATHYPAPTL